MAGKLEKRTEKDYIHVFDNIYLKYDELNMIIIRKNISEKTEKVSFINEGYFVSAKALLANLYDRYALARIKDSTIYKSEVLIGIENFVNKVEDIKAKFEKVSKWK